MNWQSLLTGLIILAAVLFIARRGVAYFRAFKRAEQVKSGCAGCNGCDPNPPRQVRDPRFEKRDARREHTTESTAVAGWQPQPRL